MSQNKFTTNNNPTLVAVSNADGETPVYLYADPATHGLILAATLTGSAIPATGLTTAAAVQIVDASGNQITSFGGGTQYTQGGATVANPTGTAGIYFDVSGNPKAITPSQPMPSNFTDGTNAVNVLKSDGTAAGQNAALTARAYKEVALSLGPTPTAGQFLLASTDVSGYQSFTVQFAGTWTGTYIIEVSNDNTTFSTAYFGSLQDNGGFGGVSSNQIVRGPVDCRYLRIRCSVTGTGTTTGVMELFTLAAPRTINQIAATQSGTWTVGSNSATGSAVPANAFAIGVTDGTNLRMVKDASSVDDGTRAGIFKSAIGAFASDGSVQGARTASNASNTTGTGLLGVAILGWDGTNYQRIGSGGTGTALTTQISGANSALAVTGSTTGAAVPSTAFYMGIRGGSSLLNGANAVQILGDADNGSNTLAAGGILYNGTTYDRGRNNTTAALIAAGTTSTQTGITLTTYNASRATFIVNIASGAGTVTVAINETSTSGYSTNMLTSTALVAGTTALRIFPGATPASNSVANDQIPRGISITCTVVGSVVYGLDVNLSV